MSVTRIDSLEACLCRVGSTAQPVSPAERDVVLAEFSAFASDLVATAETCEILRIVAGHINATFGLRHRPSGQAFIVQRVNPIFDLAAIDNNLQCLEAAQAASDGWLPADWQPVQYLAVAGTPNKFHYDAAGGGWRVMRYLPGDIRIFNTFSQVPAAMKTAVARSQGEAIAIFGRMLATVPAARWHTPLPHYHHTPYHLDYLDAVLRGETVPLNLSREPGRFVTVQPAFAQAHASRIDRVRDGIDRWRHLATCLDALGEAVAHGDTKINNFVFRPEADGQLRCVCLIDLDTVQVGNRLDDLGDALRSAGTPAGEEPPSLDDVTIDREVVNHLIAGYLDRVRAVDGPERADALASHALDACRLFLYCQCIRFFADALVGNAYYALKPGMPDDINLYRAEVQMHALELLVDG